MAHGEIRATETSSEKNSYWCLKLCFCTADGRFTADLGLNCSELIQGSVGVLCTHTANWKTASSEDAGP